MHALVIALLLAADPPPPPPLTTANDEPIPFPTAEPEPIPRSFSLYVSFLEPSFAVFNLGSAASAVGSSASATFRFGGVFGGRHAILFGLSAAAFLPLSGSGGGGISVTFAPAYRIHFRVLTPGGFSPFLQLEGVIGTVIAGTPSLPVVLGFGPGFGAEHLFTRHFGFAAAVGARVSYVTYSNLAFASVSLWASVAVAMHF